MFEIISGRRDRGAVPRAPLASARAATILLCTLNGERFLAEQLDSLERQTFKNWTLIASDDGSSDRTESILQDFRKSFEPGKVKVIDGPRRGVPANFLSLACRKNLISEYYAFCDQDDVWEADKLARAIDILERAGASVPALYGSRICGRFYVLVPAVCFAEPISAFRAGLGVRAGTWSG
jgi:glycosyltransferase involved in cell wall biosynthesis